MDSAEDKFREYAIRNPTPQKRIVLQHHSGLMEIMGVMDTQPPDYIDAPGIFVDGVESHVNLVAVKRTYYLYKPVMFAADSDMQYHEEQQ